MLNSLHKKTIASVASIVTAAALALSGCSQNESTSAGESGFEQDDSEADSEESEVKKSTRSHPPLEGNPPGPDVEYEPGEFPNAPEDFKPVKNGSRLKFGDRFDIAIQGEEGEKVYLRVLAEKPRDLSFSDVEDNLGQELEDADLYTGFRCFPVHAQFVGASTPEAVNQESLDVHSSVIDKDGKDAPAIVSSINELCGIEDDDFISFKYAEKGQIMLVSAMAFEGKDSPLGTGVRLTDNGDPRLSVTIY